MGPGKKGKTHSFDSLKRNKYAGKSSQSAAAAAAAAVPGPYNYIMTEIQKTEVNWRRLDAVVFFFG